MTDLHDSRPLARLVSSRAHALRNEVATIRSVVALVDDEEVATALDAASRSILVAVEREIVLARLELDEPPTRVDMPIGQLCDYAARRAVREGATSLQGATGDGSGSVVSVPGPWGERLVADLLHHAAGAPGISRDGDHVVVSVPLRQVPPEPLDDALVRLAGACGGTLVFEGDEGAVLRLPLVASLSVE
jgi:hypothetical protein